MEKHMRVTECPECHGNKLKPELLAVTVGGKNIMQFCDMSVAEAIEFIDDLKLSQSHMMIAAEIIKEIRGRLKFACKCRSGLPYALESIRNTFRRRVTAYKACNTDRLRVGWSPLYTR